MLIVRLDFGSSLCALDFNSCFLKQRHHRRAALMAPGAEQQLPLVRVYIG
jgi:hypothetical protein